MSLDDAFKQARALEHAQKHSTNYDTTSRTAPGVSVAALKESNPNDVSLAAMEKSPLEKCFFCGEVWHPLTECRAAADQCRKCSRYDHWERVCRSSNNRSKPKYNYNNNNNYGKSGSGLGAMPYLTGIATLCDMSTESDVTITTTVINNNSVKTMIDSGSELSFMSVS